MKTRYTLLLLPVVFIPLALIAQGPLTPPAGPPAPAMKTLAQVEPRTDVATLTGDATSVFRITVPGSYYLSDNVAATASKAGIAISAANVVLDLNGYTISGVAGALRGVELRSIAHAVTVRNGVITGFPDQPGVGATTSTLTNLHFERLAIRNCAGGIVLQSPDGSTADHVSVTGGTGSGIELGTQSLVSHCTVDGITSNSPATRYGIWCGVATACAVGQFTNTGGGPAFGIFAQQTNGCSVITVSGASGTAGISSHTVTGCRVFGVDSNSAETVTGIISTGRVIDCRVEFVGATGPGAATGISGNTVTGCTVSSVGDATTTNNIIGISCIAVASHCAVSNLGETGTAGNIAGITAQLASHCRASSLTSTGAVTGIAADAAGDCTVEVLSQGAGSTDVMIGISAARITACSASTLSGNSTATVSGFSGYRHASGCDASTISNAGTGASRGFSGGAGQTLQCNVFTTGDAGVFVTTGGVVRGCTIRLASNSGTGIDLSGPFGVAEDNVVANCATGINAFGSNCFVVRNRLTSCTSNIATNATNQTGPTVATTGTIATTNPWANFTD